MINLKTTTTIGDNIEITYNGPGFYSGTPQRPLQDGISLEKIADVYHDKEDVYEFAKFNGYKVKPYKITNSTDIPSHWCVNGCIDYTRDEDNF